MLVSGYPLSSLYSYHQTYIFQHGTKVVPSSMTSPITIRLWGSLKFGSLISNNLSTIAFLYYVVFLAICSHQARRWPPHQQLAFIVAASFHRLRSQPSSRLFFLPQLAWQPAFIECLSRCPAFIAATADQLCLPVRLCHCSSCLYRNLCLLLRASSCPSTLINLHYWSILTTGATAATFIANRVSCFVPSRCPWLPFVAPMWTVRFY